MPLYHHANRQKTPPQQLSGNYTFYASATAAYAQYIRLYQNGSGLQLIYENVGSSAVPPQYANNGYWVNNTSLIDGVAKTITAKMSWNTVNHGGWVGICFRNSSNQYTDGVWAISYTNPSLGWRRIGFTAPGGSYNTTWTDVGKSFSINENFWLQINDNPSTGKFDFRYSLDGVNFTNIGGTPTRLGTVDQWCIAMVPYYNGAANGLPNVNIHEITIA